MNDSNVSFAWYEREHARLTGEIERLKSGNGNGTSGGMDPWQTSVETRLGQLHDDVNAVRTELSDKIDSRFFWLLGVMGTGFLVIGGAMVTGYFRLADAITALHH